jgi:hypothetical protein
MLQTKLQAYDAFVMTVQLKVIINRKLPDLESLLESIPDWRQHPQYSVRELALGVIFIFLFKRGSRNNADNTAKKGNFAININKVFSCRMADTDTCNLLMVNLSPDVFENIKQVIVQKLLRDKTFARWKTKGKKYCIAIDGTGVHSFKVEPYPNCCYKESKNGIRTYTSSVMEAKLLCSNGFSISIMTEWIINDPKNNQNIKGVEKTKQDCEQKAFARLAKKLKAAYPQLAICILGDGLYPNDTIFNICKANNWDFIFTFKDGNLKTIWEEITAYKQDRQTTDFKYIGTENSIRVDYNGFYCNNLTYKKHKLNVIETTVKTGDIAPCRFVHITNIEINNNNFKDVSHAGRLRWKIENEGFNEQKNGGYNLSHKFARKSHQTQCNYYQCLQIAHIINQLNTLSLEYKKRMETNAKETTKSLLEFGIGALFHAEFDAIQIQTIIDKKCQFRY